MNRMKCPQSFYGEVDGKKKYVKAAFKTKHEKSYIFILSKKK
jgi:hypothetical protein